MSEECIICGLPLRGNETRINRHFTSECLSLLRAKIAELEKSLKAAEEALTWALGELEDNELEGLSEEDAVYHGWKPGVAAKFNEELKKARAALASQSSDQDREVPKGAQPQRASSFEDEKKGGGGGKGVAEDGENKLSLQKPLNPLAAPANPATPKCSNCGERVDCYVCRDAAKPAPSDEKCERCEGEGTVKYPDMSGTFVNWIESICPLCNGTGRPKREQDG